MPKEKTKKEEKAEARLYDPKRFISLAQVQDFQRIPTGWAAFDLYTDGGFPRGANSLIVGPKGTGKTNLALMGIAGYQRLYPKEKILYNNVDNKLDTDWAETLGTNNEMIEEFRPTSAEECHDITYHVAEKRMDLGLVLIDSLAALSSEREVIGKQEMGVAALANNKFFRKMTTLQLLRARKGHPLTLIVINQERVKVGLFPVPTIPGGLQQEYQAALLVKFMKADPHIDKATGLPLAITMRYRFDKNHGGANGYTAETKMATTPHGPWLPGMVMDHEFLWVWWWRFGLPYSGKKEELIQHWRDNKKEYEEAKKLVGRTFKDWISGKLGSTIIKEEAKEKKEDAAVIEVEGGTIDEQASMDES